jgi:metal-responsive CopG/Arc/MetJ family transcriptional regulator
MATIKTAISLPQETFDGVETLAVEEHRSRSSIIAEAVREYLERRAAAELEAGWNAVADDVDTGLSDAERAAWRARQRKLRADEQW